MNDKNSPNTGLLQSLELFEWTARELPIRFFGDAVLRTIIKPIGQQEFGSESVKSLAEELVATLTTYRKRCGLGRGLAANQIGCTQRMIVVWFDDEPMVLCNPEMTESEALGSYWESCISSGTLMVGEVYRPWTATFKYFDTEGHEHTLAADDKQTRILLHEIDHLDGIICSDKYEPKTFRYVTGGREELMALPSKRLSA